MYGCESLPVTRRIEIALAAEQRVFLDTQRSAGIKSAAIGQDRNTLLANIQAPRHIRSFSIRV
jgi:hypothetical protein